MLVMSLSLCWAHAIRRSSETIEIVVFPRRGSHFRGSIVPKLQGEKHSPYPPRDPWSVLGCRQATHGARFWNIFAIACHSGRASCVLFRQFPVKLGQVSVFFLLWWVSGAVPGCLFVDFPQFFNECSVLSCPNSQKIENMAELLNILALPYYSKVSGFYKSPKKRPKSMKAWLRYT